METTRKSLSPAEIQSQAVDGCTDVFRRVRQGAKEEQVAAFRQSISGKSPAEINDIVDGLVKSTARRPSNGNGKKNRQV